MPVLCQTAAVWLQQLQRWVLDMCERVASEAPAKRLLPVAGWTDSATGVTVERNVGERTRHKGDEGVVGLFLNGNLVQRLATDVYQRLELRYTRAGGDRAHMHTRMVNMALRHQQVQGQAVIHQQLPIAVFRLLKERLGVELECFASPFNARLERYCSVFPDCDAHFGSEGSFFDLSPTSGSFEVSSKGGL